MDTLRQEELPLGGWSGSDCRPAARLGFPRAWQQAEDRLWEEPQHRDRTPGQAGRAGTPPPWPGFTPAPRSCLHACLIQNRQVPQLPAPSAQCPCSGPDSQAAAPPITENAQPCPRASMSPVASVTLAVGPAPLGQSRQCAVSFPRSHMGHKRQPFWFWGGGLGEGH